MSVRRAWRPFHGDVEALLADWREPQPLIEAERGVERLDVESDGDPVAIGFFDHDAHQGRTEAPAAVIGP